MSIFFCNTCPFGHCFHLTQDFAWFSGRSLSCWHLLCLPSSSSPAPPTSTRWWSSSACLTIYILDDIGNLGGRKTLMTLMMKRNLITQQTSMILITFLKAKIVTSLDTRNVPLTELYFPSFVACNTNQVIFKQIGSVRRCPIGSAIILHWTWHPWQQDSIPRCLQPTSSWQELLRGS